MRRTLYFLALFASGAAAQLPSQTGQTGLLNMPDARIAPEGEWRTGLSFQRPYQAIWSGAGVLPWFEGGFRYTRIMYVPAFSDRPDTNYGDYKDKSFDAKVRLLPETGRWPAISLGAQDVGGGTGLFKAYYGAASKRVGEFDFTLGYGSQRIDGLFGGARYSPASLPGLSFVAEYDAFDYKNDFSAAQSGAANFKKGPGAGVEYKWGWFGAKVFASHGEPAANLWVAIPLEQKEFLPKIDEPAPYTRINPRPSEAQWESDPAHRARLGHALMEQDFRDIRLDYRNGTLAAELTNSRISSLPRAVGRAARTMLSFAPLEVRELRVTYKQGALPVATYTFIDAKLLQRYFNGMATRRELEGTVAIEYAKPAHAQPAADRAEALEAFAEPLPTKIVRGADPADVLALRGENVLGGKFWFGPGLAGYFNDPAGAFKFEISAIATWQREIAERTFLIAEGKAILWENVSDVTQPSNSELPHVRTDVAEYKRATNVKVMRLLANRYYHLGPQLYARASAGIYEEMFGGAGGQVLYMGSSGRWAADIAADWVKQRDYKGTGFFPYNTVTSIASLNYRMANDVTATVRAGRFLAKDEGARFEVKRRFASGFEVGLWYTATNGNDITSPGTPSNPYHDKGIFMLMPLHPMLTRDTQATAGMSLAPWTRDVGQMVQSPGDLFRLLERPTTQMRDKGGMELFGDLDDGYNLPMLGAARRWPEFVADDLASARDVSGKTSWSDLLILGTATTLVSATLDKTAFNWADKHKDSKWLKNFVNFGDALPAAALGLAAIAAYDDSRAVLSDAGVAALEAGAASYLAAAGLKYAVGRARPTTGLGTTEFQPFTSDKNYDSFPSRHTAAMWAAVTPFAKEYDAKWLYAVAALTNLSRIGGREHWVSDTVAGSVLGYALGHFAWQARRESRLQKKEGPELVLGAQTVSLAWELQ